MSFLAKVCRALKDANVRYAVVGGYAVALHGAVRGTVDVDLAIDWTLDALTRAEQALGELGLVSRLPLTARDVYHYRDEYVANRNLIAWNFYNPDDVSEQVDIIVTYDLRGRKLKRFALADGPVSVLALEELLEMKRSTDRPQDLEDVKALERLV